jgi:hypothetical protein
MEGRLSAGEAIALAQRTNRALVVQLRCAKEDEQEENHDDVNTKGLEEALEQNEEVKSILGRSVYIVLDKGDVDARNLRQAYGDIKDEPALIIISPESGNVLLLVQGDECCTSGEVAEKIVAAHKEEEARKLATLLALTAVSRQNDDGGQQAQVVAATKQEEEERNRPERTTTTSGAKGVDGGEEKPSSLPRQSTPEPLRNRNGNETSSRTTQADDLNGDNVQKAKARTDDSVVPVKTENLKPKEEAGLSKRREKQREEKKAKKQPGKAKARAEEAKQEPQKLTYTHCQLNIRLLNGESLTCNFEAADKLGDVYKYVRENRTDGSQSFSLKIPFSADNSTLCESDFGKSLRELDLGPRSLLILVADATAAGAVGSPPPGSIPAPSSPLLSLVLRVLGLLFSPVYYLLSLIARGGVNHSNERSTDNGQDAAAASSDSDRGRDGSSSGSGSSRRGRSFADKKNKNNKKKKDDDQQYWNGNSTAFLSHNKDQ